MERMRAAGLEVWVDDAANIHGSRSGSDPSLPMLLFGSHIDSVPKGGNFDGDVGRMGALEVMLILAEGKAVTRHPLEMVIWSNEEGVHFKGLFGSRAAARRPRCRRARSQGRPRRDPLGVAAPLRVDPAQISEARFEPSKSRGLHRAAHRAGRVLHRRGIQIGVVEGIVGIDRFDVTIEGFANHAGTTPMDEGRTRSWRRRGWFSPCAKRSWRGPAARSATSGWIQVSEPGAPNVVPGLVRMPIELRDLKREVIDDMASRIRAKAEAIARDAGVAIEMERYSTDEPALTDPGVQDVIETAAREAGFSTLRLPSGAGHDAQSLGRAGIPIGMIFVPSEKGVSHSPHERSESEDCAAVRKFSTERCGLWTGADLEAVSGRRGAGPAARTG